MIAVEKSKPIGFMIPTKFTIKNITARYHHPLMIHVGILGGCPNPGSQWKINNTILLRDLKINLHGTHCEPVEMGRTQVGMK